jgi:hypothetical protein
VRRPVTIIVATASKPLTADIIQRLTGVEQKSHNPMTACASCSTVHCVVYCMSVLYTISVAIPVAAQLQQCSALLCV